MSRMRVLGFVMVVLAGVVLAVASTATAAQMPLDVAKLRPVQLDGLKFSDEEFVIAGKVFKDRLVIGSGGYDFYHGYVVWKVPNGFRAFEGTLGINDAAKMWHGGSIDAPAKLVVLLDGEKVGSFSVKQSEPGVRFSIPVTPGQALKLELSAFGSIGEPRLVATPSVINTNGDLAPTMIPSSAADTASFVVEPRDLDSLAISLRKDVDADLSVRSQLSQSQIAIMTFDLIDIPSKSVARNVADDLYTSMIKTGFKLVERGQLEKAMQELKLQNTGLIDPSTAQKIGRISGCDLILLGSISDRGQFVVVNARLMETSTGKSLVAERVEMRKSTISR